MNRAKWLIWTCVTLAVAGLAVFLATNMERVTEKVFTGYKGEARYNDFLAAQRLLRQLGVNVESVAGWPREFPPPGGTLLMRPRLPFDEWQARQLMQWVRDGGHLIVAPAEASLHEDYPREDKLFSLLRVNAAWPEDFEYADEASIAHIALPGAARPLEVDTFHGFDTVILEDEIQQADVLAASVLGVHALRYHTGGGAITVLGSFAFFSNDEIGENDHAAWLWHLTRANPAGPVMLVYSLDMPPLWRWLWEHATAFVLAAACTLIVWLWRAGQRFGPPLPARETARRSLLEHITGSGRYLWRNGQAEIMLTAARAHAMRRLRLHFPDVEMNPAACAESIAPRAGITVDAARRALSGPAPAKAQDYTHLIHTLQRIERTYDGTTAANR